MRSQRAGTDNSKGEAGKVSGQGRAVHGQQRRGTSTCRRCANELGRGHNHDGPGLRRRARRRGVMNAKCSMGCPVVDGSRRLSVGNTHGSLSGERRFRWSGACRPWSVNPSRKLRRFESFTCHHVLKGPLTCGNAGRGPFRGPAGSGQTDCLWPFGSPATHTKDSYRRSAPPCRARRGNAAKRITPRL